MQTRPSTVYIKKKCVRRGTLRTSVTFFICLLLLLCCQLDFVLALLLSVIAALILKSCINRN